MENPIDSHYSINCNSVFNCNFKKFPLQGTEGNWKKLLHYYIFLENILFSGDWRATENRQCHHQTSSDSTEIIFLWCCKWSSCTKQRFPVLVHSKMHLKSAWVFNFFSLLLINPFALMILLLIMSCLISSPFDNIHVCSCEQAWLLLSVEFR